MTQLADLGGRAVLITGASSGIGEAMALACARAGAAVALCARRGDRLAALAERIRTTGARAIAVEMDVTDESSVVAAFDSAQSQLGPIGSVLANAGVNVNGRALDISMSDFDAVMSVNTRGMFMTAREAARRMIAAGSATRRHGRIVLVASIGGLKVLPSCTPYCTSKAATVMMGRSLAREWLKQGINVNVLCPGYIETEINAEWFAREHGRRLVESFPLRRLMKCDDLAPMVTHLLSDGSGAMTGAVIPVDEGQLS